MEIIIGYIIYWRLLFYVIMYDVYVCVNIWIREDLYKLMKMYLSMIILKIFFKKWGVNVVKFERILEFKEE